MKTFYNILGMLILILGFIGIFIPVLPTVPFVILSAFLFSKSNPKMYLYLKNNKYFSEFIENYESNKGVSKKTKVKALIILWSSIILTLIFSRKMIVFIILPIVAFIATFYIIRLKDEN